MTMASKTNHINTTRYQLYHELLHRLCTVSIGIPIVIIALARCPTYLIHTSHLVCILEWLQLLPEECNATSSTGTNNFSSAFFYYPIASLLIASSRNPLWLLCLFFAVFTLASFTTSVNQDQDCQRLYFHHLLQGLLFVSIGHHHLIQISLNSFPHTMYFMFIVWNCDTGALLGGKFLGGKLSYYNHTSTPMSWLTSISPNKTISGLVSGILLGIITAVYFPALLKSCLVWRGTDLMLMSSSSSDEPLEFYQVPILQPFSIVTRRVIIGFVLSFTGLLGDLVESCIKRAAGKKDSGKLLPGHGGLMDRMDSMLISSAVYLWCFMK
jgi:phosphatidate cytidylyltransferase